LRYSYIVLWRHRWPLWLTLALMLAGIPVVAICAPAYLSAAFNPLTLNLMIAALSAIGIISGCDFPTAARCRRKPTQS
jgi:DoxX-like family